MTKEINIFLADKADLKDKVYDVPVRLIIDKESYEKDKKRVRIRDKFTISFENVHFNNEITIIFNEVIDIEPSISFHNCSIKSFIDLSSESDDINLYFGNCTVGLLRAISGKINSVKIQNCFGNFIIEKAKQVEITYREESIFARQWVKTIKNDKDLNRLLSFITKFNITDVKNLNIYGHEIKQDRKKTFVNDKKLKNHGEYKGFFIDGSSNKVSRLRRLLTTKEKQKLNINISLNYNIRFNHVKTSIRNLIINSFSINGKTKSEVLVDECTINNIYIRDFSPKSDFTLYSIKPNIYKGKFEIHNSNLDNTWFNSVRLKDYFVVFHKTSFINTKFSSTILPSVKELKNSISSVENIHYPEKIKSKQVCRLPLFRTP